MNAVGAIFLAHSVLVNVSGNVNRGESPREDGSKRGGE